MTITRIAAAIFLLSFLQQGFGQSLADVLSSIQERHVLLSQRDETHKLLVTQLTNPSAVGAFPASETYINWVGVGQNYPEESDTSTLGLAGSIRVLNQAVREFDKIKGEFVKVDPDLVNTSTSASAEAVHPHVAFYNELDLPSVGLVTPENYREKLQILAVQVNGVRCTWWPSAVNQVKETVSDGGNIIEGTAPSKLETPAGSNEPSHSYLTITSENLSKKITSTWADEAHAGTGQRDSTTSSGPEWHFGLHKVHLETSNVTTKNGPVENSADLIGGGVIQLEKWAYHPYTSRTVEGLVDNDLAEGASVHIQSAGGGDFVVSVDGSLVETYPANASTNVSFWVFVPSGIDLDDIERSIATTWKRGTGVSPLFYEGDREAGGSGSLEYPVFNLYHRRYQTIFSPIFTKGLSSGNSTISKMKNVPTRSPDTTVRVLPDPYTLLEINLGSGARGPGHGKLAILNPRFRKSDYSRYSGTPENGLYKPTGDPEDDDEFPELINQGLRREITQSGAIIADGYHGVEASKMDENLVAIFGTEPPAPPAPHHPDGHARLRTGLEVGYPCMASDLRFVGSNADFVVLGEDAGDGKAPDRTTSLQTFTFHNEMTSDEFLKVWHRPVLQQVIGKNVIADISVTGNWTETTIVLYHRDPQTPLPATGVKIATAGLTSFRTITIKPQVPVVGNGFPDDPYLIEVVQTGSESTITYNINSAIATAGASGIVVDENTTEQVVSSNLVVFDEGQSKVTMVANDNGSAVVYQQITKTLSDSSWEVPDLIDPNARVNVLVEHPVPNQISTQFSPDARFPDSVTITRPGSTPNSSYSWVDGIPGTYSTGHWSILFEQEGRLATKRLNSLPYGKSETTWTGAGEEVTIVSYSKASDTSGVTTVYTFDSGSGQNSSGLPWGLVKVDQPGLRGSTTSYNLNGRDLEITTDSGAMTTGPSATVTNGIRKIVNINRFGYFDSSETQLFPGGERMAGWNSTGGLCSWGSPLQIQQLVPAGLPPTNYTFNADVPTVASVTSPYGIATTFAKPDYLYRPQEISTTGITSSIEYNQVGLGLDVSVDYGDRTDTSSIRFDEIGRPTNFLFNGPQSGSAEFDYSGTEMSLSLENTTTNTELDFLFNQSNGSRTSTEGNLAQDSTGTLEVNDGMLKREEHLDANSGVSRTVWTDSWGRVHKIEEPTTQTGGSGKDTTNFTYTLPGSSVNRVTVDLPSGRRWISESEDFLPGADGASFSSVTREGFDKNKSGTLGQGDQYTKLNTDFGASITSVTKMSPNTGTTMEEVRKSVSTPSNGQTVTTINEDEEVVTSNLYLEAPFPGAASGTSFQITISSNAGWRYTENFDAQGRLIRANSSGDGIPDSLYQPFWHSSGSMEEFTRSVGSVESGAKFKPSGEVKEVTDPVLGKLGIETDFLNDGISLEIEKLGMNFFQKFDGTNSTATGENIVNETRSVSVNGTGITHSVTATDVGQTTSISAGPSGVPKDKNYTRGNGMGMEWLKGGLLHRRNIGRGEDVVYGYHATSRDLASVTYPAITGGPGTVQELFETGFDGLPWQITDQSGVRDLTWNRGRLEEVEYTGSGPLGGYSIERDYDGFGRQVGVTVKDPQDNVVNKITLKRGTGNSNQLTGITGDSLDNLDFVYERDSVNHWIKMVKSGTLVLNSYVRVSSRGGRLTSVSSDVSGAPSFSYSQFDKHGRRGKTTTNRGSWTFLYGSSGQLDSATGSRLPSFSYSTDDIGRRTSFIENNTGDAYHLNQPAGTFTGNSFLKLLVDGELDTDFFYSDALNSNVPLTPGVWSGYSFTPTTDPNDNAFIFEKSLGAQTIGSWNEWKIKGVLEDAGDPGAYEHAVSEAAGVTWVNSSSGSYQHDDDGNRISAPGWTYIWDGRNRMVAAETPNYSDPYVTDGTHLDFLYDSDGRRVQKIVKTKTGGNETTTTTIFVWDGWDLLYELKKDSAGGELLKRKYVWGADVSGSRGGAGGAGGLLAMEVTENGGSPQIFHPLYDGNGHVIGLSDSGGTLVAEYWYGPFGELIEAYGTMADSNPWRYGTKYFDEETQLSYFGYRYYDAVTGNWLSREPLGEGESLNLYAYCHGDPVNKVDVLGLSEYNIFTKKFWSEGSKANLRWLIGVDDNFKSPIDRVGEKMVAPLMNTLIEADRENRSNPTQAAIDRGAGRKAGWWGVPFSTAKSISGMQVSASQFFGNYVVGTMSPEMSSAEVRSSVGQFVRQSDAYEAYQISDFLTNGIQSSVAADHGANLSSNSFSYGVLQTEVGVEIGGSFVSGGGPLLARSSMRMFRMFPEPRFSMLPSPNSGGIRFGPGAMRVGQLENITPRLLGSFHGMTPRAVLKLKPKGWRKVGVDRGNGWKLIDENGIERIRFMRETSNPVFSHRGGYWRRQDSLGNWLDEGGRVVPEPIPGSFLGGRSAPGFIDAMDDFLFRSHIPNTGL